MTLIVVVMVSSVTCVTFVVCDLHSTFVLMLFVSCGGHEMQVDFCLTPYCLAPQPRYCRVDAALGWRDNLTPIGTARTKMFTSGIIDSYQLPRGFNKRIT